MKTIYIDFNASSNGNGTIESPLNVMPSNLEGNTEYLIKRGGRTTLNSPIKVWMIDNVKVGAYGEGPKPYIETSVPTLKIFDAQVSNMVIDGIEFNGNDKALCVIVCGGVGITVNDCHIYGFYSPLRAFGEYASDYWGGAENRAFTVTNSEIHRVGQDAMYFQNMDNVYVENVKIYDVNRDFLTHGSDQSKAAGDGIQFEKGIRNFIVKNSYISREIILDDGSVIQGGNKFSFIANCNKDEAGTKIFTGNTLVAPYNAGAGGSGMYLSGNLEGMVIENNTFIHNTDISGTLLNSIHIGGRNENGTGVTIQYNRFYNSEGVYIYGGNTLKNNKFYGTTKEIDELHNPGDGQVVYGNEIYPTFDEIIYPNPDHNFNPGDNNGGDNNGGTGGDNSGDNNGGNTDGSDQGTGGNGGSDNQDNKGVTIRVFLKSDSVKAFVLPNTTIEQITPMLEDVPYSGLQLRVDNMYYYIAGNEIEEIEVEYGEI